MEARVAFPTLKEADEIPTPTRRFTLLEVTSGLPDDSREEDERQVERQLPDLRGQVKRARAVVAMTRGFAEKVAGDWRMARVFYARYGITESLFRHGVSVVEAAGESTTVAIRQRTHASTEARGHAEAAGVQSPTPV